MQLKDSLILPVPFGAQNTLFKFEKGEQKYSFFEVQDHFSMDSCCAE